MGPVGKPCATAGGENHPAIATNSSAAMAERILDTSKLIPPPPATLSLTLRSSIILSIRFGARHDVNDPKRPIVSINWRCAKGSFDHLVGAAEQRNRDRDAERLSGLEIEDQLDFRRLLDRQIGRFLALEDAAGIDAGQTICVANAGSVSYQTAGRRERAKLVDRRHRVTERQLGELWALIRKEWIAADHKRACPQLGHGCKDCIEIAAAARMQDMELQPEGAGLRLRVPRYGFGSGSCRVDEQGHDSCCRDQLMHQFQSLRSDLHVQDAHAREVAARAAQAGDQSKSERIEPYHGDDGDRLVCCLCWPYPRAIRDYHRYSTVDEIGRQRR